MSNVKEEIFIREFSIVDDLDVEHKCILAGVLNVESDVQEMGDEEIFHHKGIRYELKSSWTEKIVLKTLSFGLSITNPGDEFDFELGKMIAVGRAMKPKKALGEMTSSDRSMLGVEMCEAIMDQQVGFIKKNRGIFLKSNGPILIDNETSGLKSNF